MKKIHMKSFENSSVIVKFQVLFLIMAVLPLLILMYLYYQLTFEGGISLTAEELNPALFLVALGVTAGYVVMRGLLVHLVDVTRISSERLREIMGPEKIQEFLKGDENEIVLLSRTFGEITSRLEDNVHNLELTKKTLQSVLTRVGHGIASMRNIDTFMDLIVETMTDALLGKKGFLLLVNKERQILEVKTVCGISIKAFEKVVFPLNSCPFSPCILARTALIVPGIQYFSQDGRVDEGLDYPLICAPLILHDEVFGVIAVSGRKTGTSFQEEEMALLHSLASQTAVAIENSRLSGDAGKTYFETLSALAMAVEARDTYSRGHLDRVGQICVSIARHMGLPMETVANLRDGAKIHDVGKIGVPDDVLSKPAPLTEQEWVMMRRHPEIGESIIKPISSLQPLCDLVRHHHEKLDGSGYPDGLKGDEISLSARILAVADIYDALTTDRPYRKGMTHAEAMGIMRSMEDKIDGSVITVLEEIIPLL